MTSKKVVTITIKNHVKATLSGLSPKDLMDIREKFAFFADGYFFNPSYQLNRWDGKEEFVTRTGVTYVQILEQVAVEIINLGYSIKVKDERKPFSVKVQKPIDENYFSEYGWTLEEHQLKSIQAVIDAGHMGIIKVGTGGGKTLITAVLADMYVRSGRKCIIIVPKKDLVVQTKEELLTFDLDVGAYYQKEKNLDASIVVSTWQSLAHNPRALHGFNAIIVDECHGTKAKVLNKLLCGPCGADIPIRIGLTGTLPDHDTDKLLTLCALGPQVANVPSSVLIANGWLSKLHLLMASFGEDFHEEYENFKKMNEDDPDLKNITYSTFRNNHLFPNYGAESNYLSTNFDRLAAIAEIAERVRSAYGNTFILVNTVRFGTKLSKLLDNSVFISRNMSDRKQIYDQFDTSDGMIGIATYNLASTGLNIKRLFNIILVDGGKSSVRVIQTIGRGLRKARDKSEVNVLDIYSDTPFSNRHSRRREKIYKSENYEYKKIKKIKYQQDGDIEKASNLILNTLKYMKNNDKKEEILN